MMHQGLSFKTFLWIWILEIYLVAKSNAFIGNYNCEFSLEEIDGTEPQQIEPIRIKRYYYNDNWPIDLDNYDDDDLLVPVPAITTRTTTTTTTTSTTTTIKPQHPALICRNYSSQFLSFYLCESCWKMTFLQSNISVIPTNTYQNAIYLKQLQLAGLGIQEIEAGAFAHLPTLRILNLGTNNLKKISRGTFNSLTELQFLNVSHNDISEVDSQSFHGSNNLQNLDLSYNKISSITKNIFKHSQLTSLNVSNNLLATVENDFCDSVPRLNYLDLNNNLLTSIPSCLYHSNVEYLFLSFNAITFLNGSDLPVHLKELSISNNKLSYIDKDSFGTLQHSQLQSLDISNNILGKIHVDCFQYLVNLTSLDISGANMKMINSKMFSFTKSLQKLSMRKNNITFLGKDVFQYLSYLEILDLSENNINFLQIGIFKNLSSLKLLNMSHNNVEYLQTGVLNGLKTLENLDLSSNNIESIRFHIFDQLWNLKSLDLKFNMIETLDTKLFNSRPVENLISVELDGNNLTCFDLADFKMKINYRMKLISGKTFSSENIDGVSCADQVESGTKTKTKDGMTELEYFFQSKFKNTSFYKFFQNFDSRKAENGPTENLTDVVETLRRNLTDNFSNNLDVHIKEFTKLENTSFQNFLKELSDLVHRLEDKGKQNESAALQDLSSSFKNEMKTFVKFENSSFQNFMNKLSDIVENMAEARNQSNNIPEIMYELHKQNAEKLISSDDPQKTTELVGALSQLKLFLILCTLVLVLNLLMKVFPYLKKGHVRSDFEKHSHEMPILAQEQQTN